AASVIRLGHMDSCPELGGSVADCPSETLGTLTGLDGVALPPGQPEEMAQVGGAPCLARLVSDALGERQRLGQLVLHPVDGPEWQQGPSERAAKVDRARDGVAALWQVAERLERLLETRQRLPVGRMIICPVARLLREGHGLVPSLAAEGVMGQTVDVLGQAGAVEAFESREERS